MIFRLLRRNPVFLAAPLMWLGLGVIGFLYANVANGYTAAGRPPELDSPIVTAIGTLAILLWASISFFGWRMPEKATPFEMALPIPARALWASRLLSLLIPFVGGIAAAGAVFWFAYTAPVEPLRIVVGINLATLVTVVPLIFHAVRVEAAKGGMPIPLFAAMLVAVAWGAAHLGMDTLAPAVCGLVGGGLIGLVTYARLPGAFSLAATGRSQWRTAAGSFTDALDRIPVIGGVAGFDRMIRPPRWASRSQFYGIAGVGLLLNILILTGSALAVVLAIVLVQVVWLVRVMNGAAQAAHLPIRPLHVFAHAIVPGLIVAAVAFGGLLATMGLPMRAVWHSTGLALGFHAYLICWGLASTIFLARLATPSAGSTKVMRLVLEPRHWVAVGLVGIWAFFTARVMAGGTAVRGRYFGRLVEWLPIGPVETWLLAGLVLVAVIAALYRDFGRAELATLVRGVQP